MAFMESTDVQLRRGSAFPRLGPGDAARLRDLLMVRLRRRGANLATIAAVLGSSPATMHRRLKALPDDARRELEAADLGGLL
ncbi:hypothetical protein [Paludisphaera rhizosphaerae]|uniref:hypothetical protein n=1 Tax=Paludisphaera rhizosphaerae TaxID=2711216 RepID=UPI0013EDB52A|nr:hypothetical protein [Paludisphaera rhizosphaerae]